MTLTYRELRERVEHRRTELQAAGVESGRRVLLVSTGSYQDVINVLALSSARAVIAPSGVGDSEAVASHVVHGIDIRGASTSVRSSDVDSRVVSNTVYEIETSGTTSEPKRVPISDANLLAFADSLGQTERARSSDRIAQNYLPDFDPYYSVLLLAWSVGASVVLPEGREHLRVGPFIQRYGITVWDSVPSQIHIASRMRGIRDYDLSSVRLAFFGGEALYGRTLHLWWAGAPSSLVVNSYGPSETTITAFEHLVEPNYAIDSDEPVPIGLPLTNIEHLERVVIDDDRQTDLTSLSELCIRGPQRFPGYVDPHQNVGRFIDATTGEPITACVDRVDSAHWYRTGDLVQRNNDGTLTYTGRIGDMVKLRGARIHLDAVQSVVLDQDDVQDAWLTIAGGELVALVATDNPGSFSVAQSTLSRLRPHARPRVVAVRELPRTSRGKVDREAALALIQKLRQR